MVIVSNLRKWKWLNILTKCVGVMSFSDTNMCWTTNTPVICFFLFFSNISLGLYSWIFCLFVCLLCNQQSTERNTNNGQAATFSCKNRHSTKRKFRLWLSVNIPPSWYIHQPHGNIYTRKHAECCYDIYK